jgi:hypothetical protein
MAANWTDIVGNFTTLKTNKVVNSIVDCYYKTILKRFEQLSNDAREANPDWKDRFSTCLSFAEETALSNYKGKADGKPKFTYEGEAAETEEVEKDGKKVKRTVKGAAKKKVVKPKGKICTATSDGKSTLLFLLLKYVKEIKDLYNSNNNRFPEESHVLSELETFTSNPADVGSFNVSHFILNLTDRVDVNKVVEPVFGDLDTVLLNVLSALFKNENGTPTVQLTKLVTKWVQFLKLMALTTAALMWYKKSRIDGETVKLVLRQLTLFGNREVTLDEMCFQVLDEYNTESARIAEELSKARKDKAVTNKATKDAAPVNDDEQDAFTAGLDDIKQEVSEALEQDEWTDEASLVDE